MRVFGLIGYPLSHSFSAGFFNEKFRKLSLPDHIYILFPLKNISELANLLEKEPFLSGLNVTIPYKEEIIPFLDHISPEVKEIGAVNCISISRNKLTGHNTDCFGFEKAYAETIQNALSPVLVMGNGGASKAVQHVLKKLGTGYQVVSRRKDHNCILYSDLSVEMIRNHKVIINTTPIGMYPQISEAPPIEYNQLTADHILIDLIYNPEKTEFLVKGEKMGCKAYNGLQMLYYQAEKAWEIWESHR